MDLRVNSNILSNLIDEILERQLRYAQSGVGGDIGNIYIYILYIPDIPPIPAPGGHKSLSLKYFLL